MSRAALYLRVSTTDQKTDMQRHDLMDLAKARGWKVVAVYEDYISGTHDRRPQLQSMLQDAKAGQFDVLCCWKLDRLFRSLKGLICTLADLDKWGVQFVCAKDSVDLSTPTGRLVMQILACFGEFEAALIRSRVKAGVANARRNGKRWGRPKKFDWDEIRRLHNEGQSIGNIAKAVGGSKAAVHKTLQKLALQSPST